MSDVASGVPSGARATCGSARMMEACSRLSPLESSASAPARITITLSGRPVRIMAARNPLASASMPTNVSTTRPMPTIVAADVAGRPRRLRTL